MSKWRVPMALKGVLVCLAVVNLPLKSQTNPLDIVFVNGINNTFEEALANGVEMERALASTTTRTGALRREFRGWLQYNPAGWAEPQESLPITLSRDFREVAVLKVAEECFLVSINEISVPYDKPRAISRTAAVQVRSYLDDMIPGSPVAGSGGQVRCGSNGVVNSGLVSAADMEPMKSAATSLATNLRMLGKAVLVAHSQGNLLANLAYASLAADLGDDVSRMVRVVNVANASAVSVHGLDLTHDADKVMTYLGLLGLLVERATPECVVSQACAFIRAPATLSADGLFRDHSFTEAYLSKDRQVAVVGGTVPLSPGADRFVDRFVDYVYAATASIDAANSITVSSASCDSPFVGAPMTCTLSGSGLPAEATFAASNCNPVSLNVVPGGSSIQRRYSCVPVAVGVPVNVTYTVPGYVGVLPLIPSEVALASPLPAPGATNPLNDTGAVTCFGLNEFSFAISCASSEAISANERQDGMIGRDATAIGEADGALGFSFELVPTGSGSFHTKTECVRDRVTGLVWEGKPTSGPRGADMTYGSSVVMVQPGDAEAFVQYVNATAVCGYNDWRLPTAGELQGIVHYGASVSGAAIDLLWFVNTRATYYRSSNGGGVDFASGRIAGLSPFANYRARLVR